MFANERRSGKKRSAAPAEHTERKSPILAQLREGDFRGDRVDCIDHEVDVGVRVKESGQVFGQDELVDRFYLGLGVNRTHHLARDVRLASTDGALPSNRLSVHVRGLHNIAIDQHKRSDTAAREGPGSSSPHRPSQRGAPSCRRANRRRPGRTRWRASPIDPQEGTFAQRAGAHQVRGLCSVRLS